MSIVTTGSLEAFFLDLVGESLRAKGVEASGGASAYIVSLLTDFSRPERAHDEALHRPLAFLLDEAIHEPDAGLRFEKLRALGDGVLYTSGFFADHFQARGVDQQYVRGIGIRAYGTASSMLRPSSSRSLDEAAARLDLFGELASRFEAFVTVIADVADATLAHGSSGAGHLLKLYERWQKTGSERLAGALGEHGLLPIRGTRGVN
jgi:hypothetical protein